MGLSAAYRARGMVVPVLLALALLARMLVPAGFMPARAATGSIGLVLCSGSGPMAMADMAMPMGHASHHQDDHKAQDGDHACPFAAFAALADQGRAPDAPAPVLLAAALLALTAMFARPGLGLAAPPPPKTGPPLLR